MPDNIIALSIIGALGNPLMVTSVRSDDDFEEYLTNPNDIRERFEELVDIVIDGGHSHFDPSTVIDCTGDMPLVIREGKGKVEE